MLYKLTKIIKEEKTLERNLIERLQFNLRKVGHKSRQLQMQHYQNSGDLRLLRIIAHHGTNGITPSRLAERIEVALPTISRKLSVLESRQLIERRPCRTDKRKTFIHPTEKGQQLVEEEWTRFISSFADACSGMGEEKIILLTELLQELNENIYSEIHREGDDD